jgi:hypothetical protein
MRITVGQRSVLLQFRNIAFFDKIKKMLESFRALCRLFFQLPGDGRRQLFNGGFGLHFADTGGLARIGKEASALGVLQNGDDRHLTFPVPVHQ